MLFATGASGFGGGGSFNARDPGPRGGPANAGDPMSGLSADEIAFFFEAQEVFGEVDSVSGAVAGEEGSGLGPTFNANSCASCHAQPAVGGTSPHPRLGQVQTPNPQIFFGALDRVPGKEQPTPSFIRADGPVREARFIKNPDGSFDGGVHGLFTIAGRVDAPASCTLAPPDFDAQLNNDNVIFRIPTPTFGLGLVENTTDRALRNNLASTASGRRDFGIGGEFNTNGNDGTITRFGWKAQNKSLLIFAGEAYNVEQGVSNELFTQERSASSSCRANPTPEDHSHLYSEAGSLTGTVTEMSGDAVSFANFMRLLAPPTPTTDSPSELNGQKLFSAIGCALCHSPTLTSSQSIFTGQGFVTYHPYSDFALHHMGQDLADFVSQGGAGPDQFRTAPLWGVGQRIFFLHDGRANPDNGGLLKAIYEHYSHNSRCGFNQDFTSDGVACDSEANRTIVKFDNLSESDQQDILNFLRSL
ncbi:MAG TPA: di-heme oxidoredictase family protein [Myxococcales bacterium]|nr:di-heme oxidoredictase family protein [Myxococcales bacterium]